MNRKFEGVWIPKSLWLDRNLNIMEKVFLVEINSLDGEDGCFASNKHFSDFSGLSKSRCSEIIKTLESKKLVNVNLVKKGKIVMKRVIKVEPSTLFDKPNTPIRKTEHPYSENRTPLFGKPKENNTSINNTKERESAREINYSNANAIQFLKEQSPARFETFEMQYKSKIDNWIKFIKDFENKVIIEGLDFNVNKLFARLETYARNWIQNVSKNNEPVQSVKGIKFN